MLMRKSWKKSLQNSDRRLRKETISIIVWDIRMYLCQIEREHDNTTHSRNGVDLQRIGEQELDKYIAKTNSFHEKSKQNNSKT